MIQPTVRARSEVRQEDLTLLFRSVNGEERSLEVAHGVALPSSEVDELLDWVQRLGNGNGARHLVIDEPVVLPDSPGVTDSNRFPWESLTPSEGHPLACRGNLHLVHSVKEAATALEVGDLEGPLRILVVGCSPTQLETLNLEDEFNHVRAALRQRVQDGGVELFFREISRRDHLIQALQQVRPDAFHFVGHTIDRHGRRVLALGGAVALKALEAHELHDLLSHADVRCAVLNACQSDSVAHYLASRGMAAVGMRDDIRDRQGRAFAEGFYQALADGRSLAESVTEGRFRLFLEDRDEESWALPALYVAQDQLAGFRVHVEPVPLSEVQIECPSPGAARVWVNGQPESGLTPTTLQLRLNYPHEIRLEKPGYRPATRVIVPVRHRETHAIDLEPRVGRLRVVLEPALANATVRCRPTEQGNPVVETRTDTLGIAHFERILEGRYDVEASVEMPSRPIEVAEGDDETTVALAFPPEVRLLDGLGTSAQQTLRWLRRPVSLVAVGALALLFLVASSFLWSRYRTDDATAGMVLIQGEKDYLVLGMDLDPNNTPRLEGESGRQQEERIDAGNRMILEIRGLAHATQVTRFWGDRPMSYTLLSDLYVDPNEVTVGEYRIFLRSINRDPSLLIEHPLDDVSAGPASFEPEDWTEQLDCLECPVTGVDFFDAWSYAASVGKRLPRHEEWELAARGREGRSFPWGNEYKTYTYNGYNARRRVVPVTSEEFEDSSTPEGLHHMAGNVDEWVILHSDETTLETGIVGGSFLGRGALAILPYGDFEQKPNKGNNSIGFRCVADEPVDPRMVRFPPGEYPIGGLRNYYFDRLRSMESLPGNLAQAFLGEEPQQLDIESFYLDASEVSVADYSQFLDAVRAQPGLRDSLRHPDFPPGASILYQPEDWEKQVLRNPVTEVHFYMADAYCRWRGKRLPTIFESELAMGGANGRLYPTGRYWDREALIERYEDELELINVSEVGSDNLVGVADTRYVDERGFYHLYGNVSEWVVDPRQQSGTRAYIKGGNFDQIGELRTFRFFKEDVEKAFANERIGFRCAMDG